MLGIDLWESFKRRTVFGFHGNTASRITYVEEYGFHREGLPGDWLGSGFYFWQDAPVRAWEWADSVVEQEAKERADVVKDEPMVLIAELEHNEYWADLIEVGPWFRRMRRIAEDLERRNALPAQRMELAASALHARDFVVVQAMLDAARLTDQRVDAIRCAFVEGEPVCEDSAIYDKAHVQIAVRNPEIILRYGRIDGPDGTTRS